MKLIVKRGAILLAEQPRAKTNLSYTACKTYDIPRYAFAAAVLFIIIANAEFIFLSH